MVQVPHFKCALVWRDYFGVGLVDVHAFLHALGKNGFLVAEDDGANACESGLDGVYPCLDFFGIRVEGLVHQRAWADNRHIAKEDVENLRQLVDLRLSEDAPHRQDAGVAMRGVESTSHVGAVAEHRGELQDLEMLVLVADAVLSIENVMLASAFEDDHHRDEERRQDKYRQSRKQDVKEALDGFVHRSEFECLRV